MKSLLIWVLFLAIIPCHAQLLKISGSISERNESIVIKIENTSNKSVYVPNTFQNYFFFIRKGDSGVNSASEIKEYWGSGMGIYLYDSIGNKVYSPIYNCPKCLLRPKRPEVDAKSLTYRIYGRNPTGQYYKGVSPDMVLNKINKSGFILRAGGGQEIIVKIPKSVFYSTSYAFRETDMAYKPLKAILQFANFVSSSEINDPKVAICDTVFHGWTNSTNDLNFKIRVVGKPRHIDDHIMVGR